MDVNQRHKELHAATDREEGQQQQQQQYSIVVPYSNGWSAAPAVYASRFPRYIRACGLYIQHAAIMPSHRSHVLSSLITRPLSSLTRPLIARATLFSCYSIYTAKKEKTRVLLLLCERSACLCAVHSFWSRFCSHQHQRGWWKIKSDYIYIERSERNSSR